jgi:hypothetical protein
MTCGTRSEVESGCTSGSWLLPDGLEAAEDALSEQILQEVMPRSAA